MTGELTSVREAPSGRWAVLTRATAADPWVQVESCLGQQDAIDLVDMYQLNEDESHRRELIAGVEGEEWGDDAPREMPA